jgi:hypothetical protein
MEPRTCFLQSRRTICSNCTQKIMMRKILTDTVMFSGVSDRKMHTKYSRVLGMSRMDLTPAQTTVTAVRPSSVKSAETSMAATNMYIKNECHIKSYDD